ncbi:hypothetical protein H0194_02665 [Corynebacterium incognita]|uniref:Uncharacterized protein n=1 Tax=Corynebacterium incognita TaxID=2754725 RepID=A0A7G7CQT7_9CORY|nr:hypothetical protein [Corynebacterium incognita]QNE89953.1 hypothetical protein H0194_02665 [Corynebacterium incognita]
MKNLAAGKIQAGIILIAALIVVYGVFAFPGFTGRMALALGTVLFSFAFSIQLLWSRKMEGLRRKEQRENTKALKPLAKLASLQKKVALLKDTSESSFSDLNQKIQELESGINYPGSAGVPGSSNDYLFPFTVSAHGATSRNSHMPGRNAAGQDDHPKTPLILRGLLESGEKKIVVSGVFDEKVRGALADKAEIRGFSLAEAPGALGIPALYLVIQESELEKGAWAGILDAQGTSRFRKLVSAMRTSANEGTVVVVIADGVPSHMTGSLRNAATLLLSPQGTREIVSIPDTGIIASIAQLIGEKDASNE